MGDRVTLERIFSIMRGLLLVKLDGLNPIPRKGTTRHECYRALYEIQELLETRRYFGKHLPQTNADRIRAMSDEELVEIFADNDCGYCRIHDFCFAKDNAIDCEAVWQDWLKQESKE